MANKISITVGIPAYNEEKNIGALLHSILYQKQDCFNLEKIIVVSEGSTDKTNQIVEKNIDKRIRLITGNRRHGQTNAQNIIFNNATTDLVIIFEADTKLNATTYLNTLIDYINNDKNIGLIQGNQRALAGTTFIGKITEAQTNIYTTILSLWRSNHKWFVSGRGGRCFARNVYQKLRWPHNVPEDSYALLWCVQNGISTTFATDAISLYRTSQTIEEVINQHQKNYSGMISLYRFFPKKIVHRIYKKNIFLQLLLTFAFICTSPVLAASYIFIKIHIRRAVRHRPFTDFWPTNTSTKSL